MTTKIDIKLPDGVRVNRKILAQIAAFKSGIASGNADLINAVFARASQQYFVEGARGVPYKAPQGANLTARKSRKPKFVKGKFVSRTGQLKKAFTPLRFTKLNSRLWRGTNESNDVSVKVNHFGAEIEFKGRSAMILGIDKAKKSNKRNPIQKAMTTVSNTWKKLVAHKVMSQVRDVKK